MKLFTVLICSALAVVSLAPSPGSAQALVSQLQTLSGPKTARGFRHVTIDGSSAAVSNGDTVFVYDRNLSTGVWEVVKELPGYEPVLSGDYLAMMGAKIAGDEVFELRVRDKGGPNNWGRLHGVRSGDPDQSIQVGNPAAYDGPELGDETWAYSFPSDEVSVCVFFGGEPECPVGVDLPGAVLDLELEGDTLVVGYEGGASVYRKSGPGFHDPWLLAAVLSPAGGEAPAGFGASVTLSGDTVAVGAPGYGTPAVGAAYVFERNLGGANAWGQSKRIIDPDGIEFDEFGLDVALRSDMLLVSSRFPGTLGLQWGAVFSFARHEGSSDAWGQIQKITQDLDQALERDRFGAEVALTGDAANGFTALVGFEGWERDESQAFIYGNKDPGVSAFDLEVAKGSADVLPIAQVFDDEQPVETLTLLVDGAATSTVGGITVSDLTIGEFGIVTADVIAACDATDATFVLSVEDEFGLETTSLLDVEVGPSAGPVLAVAGPLALGAPNHKYRSVSVSQLVTATDACDGDVAASLVIEQVTSDEPDDAPGGTDGRTLNDIVALSCTNLRLRAERAETGNGRVYGVTVRAVDSEGSVSRAVAQVVAPVENAAPAVQDAPAVVVPVCP